MFGPKDPFGRYPYSDPAAWTSLKSAKRRDLPRFVRLWVTEGLPFAFRDNPMDYERAREALARVLSDNPKNVSVSGSGRTGFSMSPTQFGRHFSDQSDLDVFLVSENFFAKLSIDANTFIDRYSSGDAIPRTSSERKYWPDNAKRLPQQIEAGFIDSMLIPIGNYYPSRDKVSHAVTSFNYSATGNGQGGKIYKTSSLRVYKDWDSAVRKIERSLRSALEVSGCVIM